MTTTSLRYMDLDDRALLDAAKRLATDERRATAALLRAIMEIDSRRLYLGGGCASMFAYCTQVLHLSEAGAYNRIEAARAARKYPVILELFEQSAITLTAVRLLAPHLTPDNHVAVLASARHQSKRHIEELVVSLRPKPDAPVVVRRLPEARATETVQLLSAPSGPEESVAPSPAAVECRSDLARQTSLPPARIAPLAPERYRIQLTVSRETHDKLRRAQALLRHALPTGDAAEILDPRAHAPGGDARASAIRGNAATAPVQTGRRALPSGPGRCASSGVAARWSTLHVRRHRRALPRDRVSRVPPHRALRGRRRGDG